MAPISISGSGTITGISAGGLPDDSIIAADIAAGAVTTAKIADANITAAKLDGAQSGSAPIYGARAWVNFNGTGAVAIRASGNVSSITDNGVGQYSVNFTTAMPDANYCFQVNAQDANNGMGVPTAQADPTRTITASALPIIYNYPPDTSYYDAPVIAVAIFR